MASTSQQQQAVERPPSRAGSSSVFEYTAQDDSVSVDVYPAEGDTLSYSHEPLQCFTWGQLAVALLVPYPTGMLKGADAGWRSPCGTVVPLAQLLGWRVYRFGTVRHTLGTWSFIAAVLFLCFAIAVDHGVLPGLALVLALYYVANGTLLTLSPAAAYLYR